MEYSFALWYCCLLTTLNSVPVWLLQPFTSDWASCRPAGKVGGGGGYRGPPIPCKAWRKLSGANYVMGFNIVETEVTSQSKKDQLKLLLLVILIWSNRLGKRVYRSIVV